MKKFLPGYSILEVAIVLMVLGILMMGALKGKDLIDMARLHRLVQEVQNYQVATVRFYEVFHALPGDFDQASMRIRSDLPDGNNNGVIEGDGLDTRSEAYHAWRHLGAAKFIDKHKPPSGFGTGVVTFRTNPRPDLPGTWLQLGKPNGVQNTGRNFTPRQAQTFIEKLGGTQVIPDHGSGSTECILPDGSLNTAMDKPVCILYISINI